MNSTEQKLKIIRAGKNKNQNFRVLLQASSQLCLDEFALYINQNEQIYPNSFFRFPNDNAEKEEYICVYLDKKHRNAIFNGQTIKSYNMGLDINHNDLEHAQINLVKIGDIENQELEQ